MKNKFKGTQGKWEVKDISSKLESTIYSDKKRICDVKSYGSDFVSLDGNGKEYSEPTTEERMYNEKLIANAPEMLDILCELENDNNSIPEWLWIRVKKVLEETLT